MVIAIASGKGGTGKTTFATNLGFILAAQGEKVAYLDCDVEEPNGHIFLSPVIRSKSQVSIPVPKVNESRCTYCRACSDACRYSAIVVVKEKVLTFPNLCHGCGGCALACPEDAIQEVPRPIGAIEEGRTADGMAFVHGRLEVGEGMSPPVIRSVLRSAPPGHIIIADAPPGTSCPVIESVKGADVVLLVTEPTPFGLNDLKLAVETVRALGLPFGVAVNRVGVGDLEVFDYCDSEGIPVLLELPDDRRVAECYSRGELVVRAIPELKALFMRLAKKLFRLAGSPRTRTGSRLERPQVPEGRLSLPEDGPSPEWNSRARELVIISGKGGTGKTSLVSSFFALAESAAVADCDVDAADLHLVLDPHLEKRKLFSGGYEARIDRDTCDGCGLCAEYCRFEAIRPVQLVGRTVFEVDPISCEGCGVCTDVCAADAASMIPSLSGEWFVSGTRHGPMVHARLGIARENSGKLVSLVRREAQAVAKVGRRDLLLVDGSPGIGCPVIASITGARMVLVVTEPTLSAMHDLRRVAELTHHFKVSAAVCINKVDINPELSDRVRREAEEMGLPVLGTIRYDTAVTSAQVQGKTVVEGGNSPAAEDIRALWERVSDVIHRTGRNHHRIGQDRGGP